MNALLGRRAILTGVAASAVTLLAPAGATARTEGRRLRAGPDDYRRALRSLQPGDVLSLDPGEYRNGLPIHGLRGALEQPIVIEGPAVDRRALFIARPGANTVSIVDAAHIVIRNLVLDGQGQRIDAVKAEGHARFAHHIRLERLTIAHHGAHQQNVGISTKCPAWGWVVRNCTVIGSGTGMYFGDSDGSAPFFASLIEDNRVINPIGYCLQIKHQLDRPAMSDAPSDPATTVIRRNAFLKIRGGSAAESARPNVLVGHWPLAGPGARDRYLIYRNFFFDNPNEALFQAEGNVALYNNLLVNPHGDAVRIQPHNHQPRDVSVFQNSIIARGVGISLIGGEPGYERWFERNLVAGTPPLAGAIVGDNRIETYDRAAVLCRRPHGDVDDLDLSPTATALASASSLPASLGRLPQARLDYGGRERSVAVYGACAADRHGTATCR